MKKIFFVILLFISTFQGFSQIRMGDFSLLLSRGDSVQVPVLVPYGFGFFLNRKMWGHDLAYGKVDSLHMSNDSVFEYNSGRIFFRFTRGGGSGGSGTKDTAVWGKLIGTISAQADLMALFNSKQAALPIGSSSQYIAGNQTLRTFSTDVLSALNTADFTNAGPLSYSSGFILPKATSSQDGYMSASDFNNALTGYNRSVINFTISGTTTKTATIYLQNGGIFSQTWTDLVGGGGSGSGIIQSINSDTTHAQTIITASSGTDFTINTVLGVTTVSIPSANATNRGLLTPSDYTTFTGKLNKTDTAAMLLNYIRDSAWGLIKVAQKLKVDSAKVASIYNAHHYADSLKAIIQNLYAGSLLYSANDTTIAGDSTLIATRKRLYKVVDSLKTLVGTVFGDAFLAATQTFSSTNTFSGTVKLTGDSYSSDIVKTKVMVKDTITGITYHTATSYVDLTGIIDGGHVKWSVSGGKFIADNTSYFSSAPNGQIVYGTGTGWQTTSNFTFLSNVLSSPEIQTSNSGSGVTGIHWFKSDRFASSVYTSTVGSEIYSTSAFIRIGSGSSDFGNISGTATYNRMYFDQSTGITIISQAPYGNKISLQAANIGINGQLKYNWSAATDAAYTVAASDYFVFLPTITANRVITLPSTPATGTQIKILNSNTSGTFSWSFSGTVKDLAGATITTLTNGVTYVLDYDGTQWRKE